jgi:D-alanyl-D-alanine dipeptidase
LTKKQVSNRQLLRQVMTSQQFKNIPSEWWHFNAFSRKIVKSKYKIIP